MHDTVAVNGGVAGNARSARAQADCVNDDVALAPDSESSQGMRRHLLAFLAGLDDGTWSLRLPAMPEAWVSRGCGHFHLASELFIQLAGWTDYEFPHGSLHLGTGEALLIPPRLLHSERVGAAGDAAFCNLVLYAEGGALRCHLACEVEPGVPGMLHLETCRHAQAVRVHDWLLDAGALAASGATAAADSLALRQVRGLVAAAVAGALRLLADPARHGEQVAEPQIVSRTRVLVQNQLGDHQLSVRRLAQQVRCTPDYLSNVFSTTTGEHLTAFINRQRIARAARLLRESTLSSKEIAWACGFSTQTYFIRTFRARLGLTPKAWRLGTRAG